MNKKILTLGALLLLVSWASALEMNVSTMPAVLQPGGSGLLVVTVGCTTGATGLDLKVKDSPLSVEGTDSWTDLGDCMGGVVTKTFHIAVPDDLAPGTYTIPMELQYTDAATGKSYEEEHTAFVTVSSSEDLKITLPDHVYGGVKNSVPVKIRNNGPTIYNATLIVPGKLGNTEMSLGNLEHNETTEVYVPVIPTCANGIYEFNAILTGITDSGAVQKNITYVTLCYPPQKDLSIEFNVPDRAKGTVTSILTVRNNLDVAIGPLTIALKGSNVELGGTASYTYASIPPRGTIRIPVTWRLVKTDEPGAITVTVAGKEGARTYSFAVLPAAEPDIRVYPSDVKWDASKLQVTLTVANIGTGTADTVFVQAEGNATGESVIGDLSPGDYDTATISIHPKGKEAEFKVLVSYTENGEKKEVEKSITVSVPEKNSNVVVWIGILVAVTIGIWWWRKKR